MKESGQDTVLAKLVNYGARAARSGRSAGGRTPAEPAPVHNNVDAPFKPLAPFVPEEHWAALERRMAPGTPPRLARWAAAIRGTASAAGRLIAALSDGSDGKPERPVRPTPDRRKDRGSE